MATMSEARKQCSFYLPLKKRCCRMQASKGSLYCGEHFDRGGGDGSCSGGLRMRCPLDPSHTVFKHQLKKHLKKCNAAQRPTPSCFTAEINNGGLDGYQPPPEDKLALSSIPKDALDALIARLLTEVDPTLPPVPVCERCHPILQKEIDSTSNGESARKHLLQQSSILGHLLNLGLLSSETAFVEFGAGRGKLSHWIQAASGEDPSIRYILVDRSNCRRKMDLYHRFDSQGPRFQRLLMDIRDLDLQRVEGVGQSQQVVGVTKHLCGAGTDFALRCLQRLSQHKDIGGQDGHLQGKQDGCTEGNQDGRLQGKQAGGCDDGGQDGCFEKLGAKRAKIADGAELGGLVFATCCHHRCSWDSYCGRGYLEGRGLTDVDFCLITKMSSWAVCGCHPRQQQKQDGQHDVLSSDEEEDETLESPQSNDHSSKDVPSPSSVRRGYSPHPREAIGLLCKRLIDEGRVWYLRQVGLQAELVAYVSRNVSLENMLIVASAVNSRVGKTQH